MTTEQKLSQWIRTYLAQTVGVPAEGIDFKLGLDAYGLDSVDAILMAGELEEAFGIEIDPARFLQCSTFEQAVGMLRVDIDRARPRPASG
jgi:acyl carrier protein